MRLPNLTGVLVSCWVLGCGSGQPSGEDAETSSSASSTSGTETNPTTTSPSETGETEDSSAPCDTDAWQGCQVAAQAAASECADACPEDLEGCEAEACVWSCEATQYASELDCAALHCPEGDFVGVLETQSSCADAYVACLTQPVCDLNVCVYERWECIQPIEPCPTGFDLEYDYTDSCEIQMPGPHAFPDFCLTTIADQELELGSGPDDCADPDVGGYYLDMNFDAFTLCPDACASFDQAGQMTLTCYAPPCE